MAAADSICVADVVTERWRGVPGFPAYRVSDLGRVQSKRSANGVPIDDWRDLAVILDGHGYPQVWLTGKKLLPNGKRSRWFSVHHVVMLAFRGPRPAGMIVRHILNNDPRDNRLVNLAYGTYKQNHADRDRHGTDQRGEKHPRAKLNNEKVAHIRRLMMRCSRGYRVKAAEVLARRYGVSRGCVIGVANGVGWPDAIPG